MNDDLESDGRQTPHDGAADAGLVDTGTIAWLLPEIVNAFDASTAALRQFRAGAAGVDRADVDLAPLRVARSHMHQAHGALELGELVGVTKLTEAIEAFLADFESDPARCDATALDAILGGCRAIVEYLEDLQGGAPQQPLSLFPSYRDLLTARGVDRIHPADLFVVDLSIRPVRADPGSPLDTPGLNSERSGFEQALLRYIRNENDSEALASLSAAVTAIDAAVAATSISAQSQLRAFWWATRGLFEALAHDGFAKRKSQHGHLKRLAGRVNLQIRKLVDGSGTVAERLFADVLFFVAIAAPVTPHVRAVQQRYRLVDSVRPDFEKQRYGRIDPLALKTARDCLGAAKTAWSAVVAGDVKQIHEFAKHTTALLDAVGPIKRRGLVQVAQVIDGIATDLGFDPRQPSGAVGLDVATALLFLEGAIERARTLDDSFDERAAMVVARVEKSATGAEHDGAPVDWLDHMSREAEERLTVATFVAELQANLRSAEKELDAFFRDPAERAGLPEAAKALTQVSGALALLGHDDVHRAIDRARETIARFEQDEVVDQSLFTDLAQTLGAVGFYVEHIKRERIDPKAFHFDPQSGRFSAEMARPPVAEVRRAEPAEPAADAARAPSGDRPAEPQPYSDIAFAATQVLDTEATLEDEIAHRAADASEHALRLRADPDDRHLRDQIAAAVDDVRRHAALIDDRSLQDEAATVLATLRRVGHAPLAAPAVAQIVDSVAALAARANRSVGIAPPALAPVEPTVAVPSADNHDAMDAELLEVFLEEAGGVLVDAEASLRVLDADPINTTATVNLRRGFHTLKGSSRMVGLMAFGDAGWAIEDTLNSHMADQVEASGDLRALIDYAIRYMSAWVAELKQHGTSSRIPDALIEGARALRSGVPATAFAVTEVTEVTDMKQAAPAIDDDFAKTMFVPAGAAPHVEPQAEPHFASITAAEPFFDLAEERVPAESIEPVNHRAEHDVSFTWLDIPTEAESPAIDVAAEEEPVAAAVPAEVTTPAPAAAPEPAPVAVSMPAPVAEPVDNVVAFPMRAAPTGADDVRQIGSVTLSVALFNIYLAEADELLRVLTQDFAEWAHELDRFVSERAMRAVHSLAGSSATVGLVGAHDVAAGIEDVLQTLYRTPVELQAGQVACLQDAVESLRKMLHRFAAERLPEPDPVRVAALIALKRALVGDAAPVVMPIVAAVPAPLPFAPLDFGDDEDATPTVEEPVAVVDHVDQPVVATAAPHEFVDEGFVASEDQLEALAVAADNSALTASRRPSEHVTTVTDDIDHDLLEVFVEEGNEILPQIGTLLRTWQAHRDNPAPARTLLRHLHTLKGSARMAGAMRLGEVVHDIETRVESAARLHDVPAALIDELLAAHDRSLELFDRLQSTEPEPAAAPVAETAAVVEAEPETVVAAAAAARDEVAAPRVRDAKQTSHQMVRVNSETLDRLVNLAGEVSISRARIENEVQLIKDAMADLSDNVERLRSQLREIELQAEFQMQSKMQSQQGAGAERDKFDPLEFDRFTRFQELTRMMAESVNDVKTVQQNLQKSLDTTEVDLTSQRRMTRDLQHDLMAVRMVPFSSMAERLYRVARRSAKEVDKRVNLDIRGGTVEIDRSVLERMAGPFEHLLRNHIVHGIESRDMRRAAGKSEIGELLVEIRQEGNEIVLTFSDDGAGLDRARIRAKGRELGLIGDVELDDPRLADLIFHPGFSTVTEITELAGRGVGMDVVRAETTELAGRVAVDSQPGKGTRFTINLPLTLAVTQVVLVTVASRVYALPAVLVEQVQQMRQQPLADAYRAGHVVFGGAPIRMAFLGTLLGIEDCAPVAQRTSPVLILRSASERVAVHVDEVIGNQEVVVKNLGPQLARMAGIAGATVLGSGEIVLILNPVPLAVAARAEAAKEFASSQPLDQETAQAPPEAKSELKTLPTVMVVDDSLTVRRVTQRLLSREGYQVVLAKDGVDALEQLQEFPPDVMLVDIEMPRMDGFDLTRNVRNDERLRHIPIIMITSRTAEKHRQHAAELGVDAYIGKPYQEDELLDLLSMHVKAKRGQLA